MSAMLSSPSRRDLLATLAAAGVPQSASLASLVAATGDGNEHPSRSQINFPGRATGRSSQGAQRGHGGLTARRFPDRSQGDPTGKAPAAQRAIGGQAVRLAEDRGEE